MELIAIVKFKKDIINAQNHSIIIQKFSYWEKSSPIIFVKADKSLEISFYNTIMLFNLAIDLKKKIIKSFLFISKK